MIRLVVLLLLTAIVMPGHRAHAQSLEPRSYANTPVGINFLLLGYGYLEGDVAFDASSPLKDAEIHSHAGLVAYARSLNVWGLSGKILAALPVADVSGSAKLKGQDKDREVLGLGDPLLRLSVNFFGAPALSMAEYPAYRQDVIVGASLQVTAPLGQYDSDKLLNVGTNRWSFKPELGVSKAWGPLTLELIPAITFFTNNDDFLDGKTLKQDPIYSLQGHLIYEFSRAFWAAFNTTYYAGGSTTIDGDKGEQLENVRLGLTAALSLSRRQSIKLSGSTGVYSRSDSNFFPSAPEGGRRDPHRPGDPAPALPLSPPNLEILEVHGSGLPAKPDALGPSPGLAGPHTLTDPLPLLLGHPSEHGEQEIPDGPPVSTQGSW